MKMTLTEIEALDVAADAYPQRFYSHDGDGVSATTITETWVGSQAVLWRVKDADTMPHGSVTFVPMHEIKHLAKYPGEILDPDNLPRGHWFDTRVLDLANEICASKVVVWDTREHDGKQAPGIVLKGYDARGRINLLAMGKRDQGAVNEVTP